MLRARVVHHEVEDDPDVAPVRLIEEMLKVCVRAVVALDGLVVGGVVAVIARRLEHRHQPDRIDAERGDVIEFRR